MKNEIKKTIIFCKYEVEVRVIINTDIEVEGICNCGGKIEGEAAYLGKEIYEELLRE